MNEKELTYEDCQYCCGDVDMRDYLVTDGEWGLYIDDNENLVGDDGLGFWEVKLKYCPMCGRKFK